MPLALFYAANGNKIPLTLSATHVLPAMQLLASLVPEAWVREQAHSCPRLILAGHSLGGTAAQVLMQRMSGSVRGTELACVTLGAPSPCRAIDGVRQISHTINIVREADATPARLQHVLMSSWSLVVCSACCSAQHRGQAS